MHGCTSKCQLYGSVSAAASQQASTSSSPLSNVSHRWESLLACGSRRRGLLVRQPSGLAFPDCRLHSHRFTPLKLSVAAVLVRALLSTQRPPSEDIDSSLTATAGLSYSLANQSVAPICPPWASLDIQPAKGAAVFVMNACSM